MDKVMVRIRFLLNGAPVALDVEDPTRTFLDWLREERGLTGTKEGCNEGDCGACTVMVSDDDGPRALNACILFLPQLDGRAVRTVEGLADGGDMHPVQQALVDHHGSQCGFCTPGFAVSMAVGHAQGRLDHDNVLAGNLCRCTGYAPIIRAAEAAEAAPVPAWVDEDRQALELLEQDSASGVDHTVFAPKTAEQLATWFEANPDATLVAGATDVGLWVTKQLRTLPKVAFLNQCTDLKEVSVTDTELRIGAGCTMEALRPLIGKNFPSYGEMIRRYGSEQVRQAATIGGNIANGSPIGDNPPPLIALGARIVLRKGDVSREVALEDFFVDYGKQDRQPGEFVETVIIPRQSDRLRVYKLSKRFDQDISAVCGAFLINVDGETVTDARIAFGGMAGIPKRARTVETALIGHPWTMDTVKRALPAFARDFAPLSDMRASASYRLKAAENMLRRAWAEDQGIPANVLEVSL